MLEPVVDAPLETTILVFVTGGGKTGRAGQEAEGGRRERARTGSEDTGKVLAQAVGAENLSLRPDAVKLISGHLGEDAGRVGSLVEMLGAAYGDGATLDGDDVAPYLGEAGSVPSYQLTNAIEAGDSARARSKCCTACCTRRPRATPAACTRSRCSGSWRATTGASSASTTRRCGPSADAIEALGGRVKEFPARKALDAARTLGTDGIRQAFDALYQADLDLKGARGIPADAVMEVLVVQARPSVTGRRAGAVRRGDARTLALATRRRRRRSRAS